MHAILNPWAHALVRGPRRRLLQDALTRLGADVQVMQAAQDAVQLAAQANDAAVLVAVGGDGTVSGVLTGMDRERQRLAVIPAGTGNCLARDLGVGDIETALRALRGGHDRRIDLIEARWVLADGSAGIRWLGSTAGLGYAADVAALAKKRFAWAGGHAYSLASLFVVPRSRQVTLAVDGAPAGPARLTGILANNTRHIGHAPAFPSAQVADGLLDVFRFDSAWVRQCLHNVRMVTGWPIPGLPQPWQARLLTLRTESPEVAMLDGELVHGVRELAFACRAGAVACIAC